MTNITARTQFFAESLPEGHPLQGKLANLLKEARIQDDLFARATVLEGALNMRPGSLSQRPVATFPDIQQNFPDINPQFFDMRRDYDLYGAVIGGAGQIKGTSYTSDEIAQALIAGLTIVNMDEVSGGSIYRRLGKKLANALKAGRVDMKGLAGTLRSWAKARAMDVIDSRHDVSIDEGFGDEGFDQASMIDRFYSDPGTSETALSISVVNKPGMLQTIDRAVRKELRGPGQEAVWDAVLNDPGLLNPSARGMGIDQQPLAEAISRMTGTEISRQVAGRTFRDKVLPAMERALANDERLQQTLMKDRDIQQVFQDAMRLARTAEWKGWTEDMPVQVVTMKGTEVFPNLAAAQKEYRDLDPRRNGRKFTWAMKDRVKGRPAIRFEAWDVNKMMSMSASLHERAIRLASENPELRAALLPLLKQGKVAAREVSVKDAEKVLQKQHGILVKALNDANNAVAALSQLNLTNALAKGKTGPLLDKMIKGIREAGSHANSLHHFARHLHKYESGVLRGASEQEAEKFDAESEAAEDQSQADEAKAEAARVKEAGRTPSGETIFSEREPLEKAMKELVEMDLVYFADPRKRMKARDIEKDLQELLATHYAEESVSSYSGRGRSRDPGGDVFNPKDILLDVEWVPNIEDGISGWGVSFSPRFDPRVAKTAAAKLKQAPEDTDFDIQF